MRQLAFLLTFITASAAQNLIDRVAVVVDNQVITESEVLVELRLTAFMNGQPLDLGPARRREAAERLVDQSLIRNEMQIGGYTMPTDADADAALKNFRQENYPNAAAFHAVLQKYGLTEEELKRYLAWQAAALRFTDQRFRMGVPPSPPQPASPASPPPSAPSRAVAQPSTAQSPTPPSQSRSSAPRSPKPPSFALQSSGVPTTVPTPAPAALPQSADRSSDGGVGVAKSEQEDPMDAWLKQARANTRIQFKKGAFQ